MGQTSAFEEQITANLMTVSADPHFNSDHIWLTFYLMGPPENLEKLFKVLAVDGWVNTDGGVGGFLYPKRNVERTLAAIVTEAETVERLCANLGIEIHLIDADTSPEVQSSKFITLFRAPA